jgi:predicted nucleic acid-binding protein
MTDSTFVDTNVLVYAADRDEPGKSAQAVDVLASLHGRFVISAQVLGEFFVIVTRKLRSPVDPAVAAVRVDELSRYRTVPLDARLVRGAVETAQRFQLSYWDALIVEAAVAGGCSRILTEDLDAGSEIHGVEIVNPFA